MKKNKAKKKEKKSFKEWGKALFSRFFGFEEGIDITNETEVLKRRNTVIKNIILLSNMLYFVLMLIVSISTSAQGGSKTDTIFNWIVTGATFPLTFAINYFLTKLINSKSEIHDDYSKQQIAMYFAVAYLFLSVFIFYIKVTHSSPGLETFSYILFYYVLTVIALYQDKKVIINSSIAMFAILTIVHFFITYNSPNVIANGPAASITTMIVDIVLRSLIFIIFTVVLYATVSIAQYMQEERVFELKKRQEVQTDYKDISGDLFKVVLASSRAYFDLNKANQVSIIASEIGSIYGLSNGDIERLKKYSLVHMRYHEIEGMKEAYDNSNYQEIKEKTDLASVIAERIQLAQKCEDIARAQTEGNINESFIAEMNRIQDDIPSQIILLADLYITMRAVESYKRPLSHNKVMNIFEKELMVFFERPLMQRFMSFHQKFAEIYDNF